MSTIRTRGELRKRLALKSKNIGPDLILRLRWITGRGEVHGDAVGRVRREVAQTTGVPRSMVRVFAWRAVGPTRYVDPWTAIVVVRGLGVCCRGASRATAVKAAHEEAMQRASDTAGVMRRQREEI